MLLLLTAPEVLNDCEATVPGTETKVLKNVARGNRGSPNKNKRRIPDL